MTWACIFCGTRPTGGTDPRGTGPEDVLTGDRRSVKESTSDIGHLDPAPGRCLGCADLGIPVPAAGPGGDDELPDVFVRGPLPENGSEILARRVGEETGVQLPIGGQPGPRAPTAEGIRHRGDDADLACAVDIAITRRDFTRIAGFDGLERKFMIDALE